MESFELALPPPETIPVMEQSRRARAACESVQIMLQRDFALAAQLGVSVLTGKGRGNHIVLDFKNLTFHHPDVYT